MKITIKFEKWSRYYSLGEPGTFYIYLEFTYCGCEDFNKWLSMNRERLVSIINKHNYDIEISYSENVIILSKKEKLYLPNLPEIDI